jgi:hypothetical protein
MKINDVLLEFAPAGSGGSNTPRGPRTPGGDDGSGDDPYSRPEPEYYSRSIDFFGRFEADHFDDEEFDKATGVFKGYWDDAEGRDQIAYFKFDDPEHAGDDDPGMGWYYEPQMEGINEFAPDSNDGGGEDDALRNYARMWWAGDEATQMQIERALAKMGWEIGEDEGGYDNGGVFVVRAGDENGNSYQSWAAEDLTEGMAEAKWNPYDQGDFPINYNANDSDEVDDTGKAEKWQAMQDYYGSRANIVAALQAQRGLMHPAHGTKHGVQAVMSTSLGKRVVKTFPNKEKAYDYAGVHNYEVVEIKDTGLATNPITLNVVLGHGEHKKQMSLQFPDMGKAQQWADRYHAEILGQGMAEGPDDSDDYYSLPQPYGDREEEFPMAQDTGFDVDDEYKDEQGMAEGQQMGEYGRVLSALGLYVPDKFSMEELNTPDWHRVIASKADVPVEYAGKVIDDFTRPVDGHDDDEWPEDDDENVTEGKPREKEADYGADYQDMVARVKKLAGLGPLKTVYDPQKRVYKNVPTAVQPKKEQR